ncbi:hypothetical protein DFK10_05240 [Salibaculum griseiflavum]|uniref:Succinate dehydrogenase n=2 Tax=Salibaculum griseiflavum TaxID=1914409 RepID=A0A2V1P759_9RHOB|nr:hypothetical protein DFK10_05240 [Salibaculum griseiflavum]
MKMKRIILSLIAATALAGCDMPGFMADPTATTATDLVTASMVGTELSGGIVVTERIARPLAECVAEHATDEELAQIVAATDDATRNAITSAVLARPEAISCATAALTA